MTITTSIKLATCVAALSAATLASSAADAPHPTAARSVHSWHYAPGAEWVYGEVTPEKSAPGTYFMTIGFSCGYCGIQELYDGRKIAIFSVWDPGDPFDFKAKADSVDEKIRTKNTYAGEGVYISRFGGEGTGGKSTMWFDWEIGKTYRFAVNVKKDGSYRAAFTGYVWRDGKWFKIATFSTLQTRGNPEISGVYSFIEDFRRTPESVKQARTASYCNFFSKVAGGEWRPMNNGRFTGDSNNLLTVDAEIVKNGLRMTTGGDTTNANVKLFSKYTSLVGERPAECVALDKFAGAAAADPIVLFKDRDAVEGVKSAVYRIPAMCVAPNGDIVVAADARRWDGGDLNHAKPIDIAIRRSSDAGKTWTDPVFSWKWKWDDEEHWAGSDPSFIVDSEAKKIFLFYNVWESKKNHGVFQFFVQESSDNGKTWSKPRDISKDLAFPEWPFGKRQNEGGFIFITSGSGIQTSDGTLLHTIVHVNDGNALFGSDDHGKTWKPFGKPVKNGDECKVVELADGSWMINSRWRGGGRQIHVSKDRGSTWESRYDKTLADPQCNAQIMRVGKALVFSNCKSPTRRALLHVRSSLDDGRTWSDGVCVCPGGAAYSDLCLLPGDRLGIVYEGAGYATINFTTVSLNDVITETTGK